MGTTIEDILYEEMLHKHISALLFSYLNLLVDDDVCVFL